LQQIAETASRWATLCRGPRVGSRRQLFRCLRAWVSQGGTRGRAKSKNKLADSMIRPSRESGGGQGLSAWLLTALFIIGLATPVFSFALTRTYFASSITSESMAALWVAKDRGFFSKYGLDVQFILMPRSAVTIASLVAGEIDMAIVGPGNLLNAATGGAEVVGVGNLVQRLDYSLV